MVFSLGSFVGGLRATRFRLPEIATTAIADARNWRRGIREVDPSCSEEFKDNLSFATFCDGLEGSSDILAEVLFCEKRLEFVHVGKCGCFLQDVSMIAGLRYDARAALAECGSEKPIPFHDMIAAKGASLQARGSCT